MAMPIRRVQLGIDNSMSGIFPHVANPKLGSFKIRSVDDKFLRQSKRGKSSIIEINGYSSFFLFVCCFENCQHFILYFNPTMKVGLTGIYRAKLILEDVSREKSEQNKCESFNFRPNVHLSTFI